MVPEWVSSLFMPFVLLVTFLVFSFLIFYNVLPCQGSSVSNISIVINGEEIEEKGTLIEDTTFVPVRGVFEQLGFTVDYDDISRTAILQNDNTLITIAAGEETICVNNEKITPPVAQRISNGHFLLPLRTVAEAISAEVNWDGDTMTVFIDTPEDEDVPDIVVAPSTTSEYTNPDEDPEKLVKGDKLDFATKMDESMPKDQNYVFSPLSIKHALAMVANGADDETKNEITDVLDITDLAKFNDSVKTTIDNYAEDTGDGLQLKIANSVWLVKDHINGGDFSESFKELVEDKYHAESVALNKNEAVSEINAWCADKTNNKITQIVSDDSIDNILSFLVNAVYFNGRWVNEFSKSLTYEEDFHDANDKDVTTDFMHITDDFNYYADKNIKIISMPYMGSNISMYVALTDNGDIDPEKYIDKMSLENVHISIPKFKIEYGEILNKTLMNLGMVLAFDSDTNISHFKPMFNDTVNNTAKVCVDKVVHKAYIDVNEEGTEAAAVTAALMETCALVPAPEKIYEFKADKPFTYFIRDNTTGEILFMGRYAFVE